MCKQFGISVIRAVIIIANVVLLIGASILIYRSAVLFGNYKSYEPIFRTGIQTNPLVSMIIGILICLFAIFGIAAICLNALGMTVFFITCLVLLGITSIAFGCVVMSQTTDMYLDSNYFYNLLDHSVNLTKDEDKIDAVESVQRDLLCCGFTRAGPEAFYEKEQVLPLSCCKDPTHTCYYDDIWENDCLFQMELFGTVTHSEISALLMCVAGQCFIVSAVGYVFAMAIRQYYYY